MNEDELEKAIEQIDRDQYEKYLGQARYLINNGYTHNIDQRHLAILLYNKSKEQKDE